MKLQLMTLVASTLIYMQPVSVQAAIVQYELKGSSISSCTGPFGSSLDPSSDCSLFLGTSFDGLISIDESLLASGTLRNQSLNWSIGPNGTGSHGRENNAALNFGLSLPFYTSVGGGDFNLTTDNESKPINWSIDILDGPPDYSSSNSGSYIFGFNEEWSGSSGVLSLVAPSSSGVTAVPLPSAFILLLSGLSAISYYTGFRRRFS